LQYGGVTGPLYTKYQRLRTDGRRILAPAADNE
jgi:hypothetical protein